MAFKQHYCCNVVTSLVVKKEEGLLAFPAECSALDWVAVAHMFKLEIEKFSVHLKIIKIRETDLGDKSGRQFGETANLPVYGSEYQESYLSYFYLGFLLSICLESKTDHSLCLIQPDYGKIFHALTQEWNE